MVEFIDQFIADQRRALAHDDVDLFLRRMVDLFQEFGSSYALQGKHINSPVFDELCEAAGEQSHFELLGAPASLPTEPHAVIVLTEVVAMGGHATLIRDIVNMSHLPVVLVVTNINRRTDAVIEELYDLPNVLATVVASETTLMQRMQTVQAAISTPYVDKIYLAVHGYDAVAIAAIGEQVRAKTSFLHHCDHYPALGNYMRGVAHLDLHNVGLHRCRHEHGIRHNRYLCMTSTERETGGARKSFAQPRFATATCGGMHKLTRMPYEFDYKELVLNLLKSRDGIHYHLGHLPSEYVQEIGGLLEHSGISRERFCYMGEAPRLAEILVQLEVDAYLPTLPQSGGKALIDVMAAGVPIILHQNSRDRLWSSVDLVYPEAPAWRDWADLNRILQKFDAEFWQQQAAASRRYFERFHNRELFARHLLEGGVDLGSADVPELKAYTPSVASYLRHAGFRQG